MVRPLVLALALVVAMLIAPARVSAQTVVQPTPTELAYFADTAPFRAHLGENQAWLEAIQQAMTGERASEVTSDELGNLTRELFEAKQGFARARPSARLDLYDRTIKSSLDRAYAAAVMLMHAQATESGPDRDALVRDAGLYTASSGKLLKDAAAALSEAGVVAQYEDLTDRGADPGSVD
jgi:hypothetical protein